MLGNEIYTSALLIKDNLANFNLNVSAGTYFVKVSNNSTNEVVVKKIVIQ